MDRKAIAHIRKSAFSKAHAIDPTLLQFLDAGDREFNFLRNPVVQNIYQYQIQYLLDLSREWLRKFPVRILDWGCGKGHVSYWLRNTNADVVSCDVVKASVTSAFGIRSPIITGADIPVVELTHDYMLPFTDSSFDVVVSFGVLEHVPNDLESLREIRRILAPNGLFFCFYLPYTLSYTQNIQHLRGQWYHKKLYGKKQVRNLLAASNLRLLDIWHRALLPKISLVPPCYRTVERADNWLCNYSFLKYFATNIEFAACKSAP
jgi:SAM-dependent methyltransferase